jgi:hypothetical protein
LQIRLSALFGLALALPAAAQHAPDFPAGRSYIVQLTGSQAASGLGDYLVPPLTRAMGRTGLTYRGDAGAEFAATVETGSDVGKWYGSGDDRAWLYTRFVTVGLSPADVDVEPEGRLAPRFWVKVQLVTPNEDRVDELNCLIALATRELAARYKPEGGVVVNGQGCARK